MVNFEQTGPKQALPQTPQFSIPVPTSEKERIVRLFVSTAVAFTCTAVLRDASRGFTALGLFTIARYFNTPILSMISGGMVTFAYASSKATAHVWLLPLKVFTSCCCPNLTQYMATVVSVAMALFAFIPANILTLSSCFDQTGHHYDIPDLDDSFANWTYLAMGLTGLAYYRLTLPDFLQTRQHTAHA